MPEHMPLARRVFDPITNQIIGYYPACECGWSSIATYYSTRGGFALARTSAMIDARVHVTSELPGGFLDSEKRGEHWR